MIDFKPYWLPQSEELQLESLDFDVIDYILKCHNKNDGGFGDYPAERQSFVNTTAKGIMCLNLLKKIDQIKRNEINSFLRGCQNSDGGFGITTSKSDMYPSNLESTYYSIITFNLNGYLPLLKLHLPKIINFVISHYNVDGGYRGDDSVISNEYFTFLAINILIILKELERVDQNLTTSFLISQQERKNPEVVFTTSRLLSLYLLNSLDRLNLKIATTRLARCQNKEGGYRQKKLALVYRSDIHSTFQSILGLNIIGKSERIKRKEATDWILSCQNENGGFGKDPKSESSLSNTFHSLVSLYYLKSL